jgi:hypothetical protein
MLHFGGPVNSRRLAAQRKRRPEENLAIVNTSRNRLFRNCAAKNEAPPEQKEGRGLASPRA